MRVTVEQACDLLLQGQPVALPTETVYGLAARIKDEQAIEKIFQLKGRPKNNPLIVHLSYPEELLPLVIGWDPEIEQVISNFWPGPLTLVLPAFIEEIPSLVRANLPTAAFRVPQHPLTQEIISRVGPLVMPSANLSGRPSATAATHVEADFGENFPVVDGGHCLQGIESTIIIKKEGEWKLLRQGAITLESLSFVLGKGLHFYHSADSEQPLCPGQLYRHYAPQAQLILTDQPTSTDWILGFEDRNYCACAGFISLGVSFQPQLVAANLYAALRCLDEMYLKQVWVDMHFPRDGLWNTIADRLYKAAQSS